MSTEKVISGNGCLPYAIFEHPDTLVLLYSEDKVNKALEKSIKECLRYPR